MMYSRIGTCAFALGVLWGCSSTDGMIRANGAGEPESNSGSTEDRGSVLGDAAQQPAAAAENVVTLKVGSVDDFLYLTVNGVRRKVVPVNGSVDETISSWFLPGTNRVRVQAVNTKVAASYSVQIRVDGALAVDANCSNAPCKSGVKGGAGILFDQTYDVITPNRPSARKLTVNGTAGGKIYINDAFTGASAPATFTLPQGNYLVGLGVGEGTANAYAGQYHEQSVQLGTSDQTVTPSTKPKLAFPNHTRVALLPIRRAVHGDSTPQNTGVLTEKDISLMHGQTKATNTGYVQPFSYGLTTWDIDLLPTVEDTPMYRPADNETAGDVERFLRESGLTSLQQTYDIIIYYYSEFTATGARVENAPCCFWGIGQSIWFSNGGMRDAGASPNSPNIYLLHESLHDYESYNEWRLGFYLGADGTHGATTHGYVHGENGEPDFAKFYRDLMRNQVAEVNTMRGGVDSPRPRSADLWVGVFDTMRRDVDWQTSASNAVPLGQLVPRGQPLVPPAS
jgi:hypothetical protein